MLGENWARLQIWCRMALNTWCMFTIIEWPLFVYLAVVPRTIGMDNICVFAGSVRRWTCVLPFLLMLHNISSEFNWWRPDCPSHSLGNQNDTRISSALGLSWMNSPSTMMREWRLLGAPHAGTREVSGRYSALTLCQPWCLFFDG